MAQQRTSIRLFIRQPARRTAAQSQQKESRRGSHAGSPHPGEYFYKGGFEHACERYTLQLCPNVCLVATRASHWHHFRKTNPHKILSIL